ncbi:MAG: zinc metalloprotease HtpX [Spirochaetota bacterium]
MKTNTTLQTIVLGAALLGVALLTGWQIMGSWALLLLAAFAGAVAISVHRTNPSIQLRGARPVRSFEAPELFDIVERLSRRAGLRATPEVHYARSRTINAATIGDADAAAIVVTDGILATLGRRELEGVLAHEIAHIRNRDLALFRFAEVVRRATTMFTQAGWMLVLFALPVLLYRGGLSGGVLLTLLAAPLLSSLLQRALLRTREFAADATAAELTGDPEGLARALERIEQRQQGVLQMLVPVQIREEGSLFRTHPPTRERVERLRSLPSSRSDRFGGYRMAFTSR